MRSITPELPRPGPVSPVHVAQVRMDRPLWEALERAANAQRITAGGVLRECAERYIKRHGG
jgi:hypothetical protein